MQERIYYPLTSPQLSIWYTEKMYPGTSIANVAGTLRIKDHYDFDRLEQAINLFIKNNDGIRLRITLDENGLPLQYISEYEYQPISFMDLSQNEDPVKAMFKWDAEQTQKSLTLLDSALYCFVIIKLSDIECGFYVNTHHIISDAWSMGLLGSEVVKYYCALKACDYSDASFSSMPSYTSYIQNDALYKVSNRYSKDKLFWEKQFETAPELTVLKSRKSNRMMTESKRKTFIAPKKFVEKLRSYCNENKTTPYPLFLSALSMYINRVTSKEDIVIGTPILNRLNPIDKSCIGMFISTVPLRINVKSETSFAALTHEMLELCSAVYRHQRYPYDLILRQAREKYGFQDNLYDLALSYQNSKFYKTSEIDYSTRWHFNGHQSNSLTIHINDRDDEGILIFDCDYHTELYSEKEIDSMYQYFLTLLWHALDNPKQQVCRLEMLPECEKKKLLFDFNDTAAEYPKDKTIQQLFEEQVKKTPESKAIICEDEKITYKDLNRRVNSLAANLRDFGVSPDSVVAIMTRRSIEMIIGILAVLKAGGAYLYIDPNLPGDRISLMLNECNIGIILSEPAFSSKINTDIKLIDVFEEKFYSGSSVDLIAINNPKDLAYIIFTSGSTGSPKAVMVEHQSLNNFLNYANKMIGITHEKTVISMAAASFDIFVFELFSTLISGATLVLTSDTERTNSDRINNLFEKYRIQIVHGTPAVINLLLEYNISIFRNVEKFIIGGEQFSSKLLNSLTGAASNAKIFNGYGPTECTVGVTFKELSGERKINIGKPIANTRIYILDDYYNPAPVNTNGELYVGGDCLARGYYNNPRLTDGKFVISPFNECERLYRTGDIAKWCQNGEIEFVGRIDHQVKINGYRIELDEIKNQIINIPGVRDAVIVDKLNHNHKKILCAYIVSDDALSADYIRQCLERHLPGFMIPSFIKQIDSIPITQNGKIDRAKLPLPFFNIHKDIYVVPKNNTEASLKKIWESVLNVKNISVNQSITNLGGDSLDIITISSIVSKGFNVDLPLADSKKINTIRKMAEYIDLEMINANHINDHLCLLKKGNKNLFFIHAGNGEIDNYLELSSLIGNDFACWGIRMGHDDYFPVNITIHQIALKYISYIKSVQPNGPYYLAGWCIGGTIAFEMANILELHNEQVNFLGLFNSIAPQIWKETDVFTPSGEMNFIKKLFGTNLSENMGSEKYSIKDVWHAFIQVINNNNIDRVKRLIPYDVAEIIPKFETASIENILSYVNGIRTLHVARTLYFPTRRLRSDVKFFIASDDNIIQNKEENLSKWSKYNQKELCKYYIHGNHFSIFKSPGVDEIGAIINTDLEKREVEIFYA